MSFSLFGIRSESGFIPLVDVVDTQMVDEEDTQPRVNLQDYGYTLEEYLQIGDKRHSTHADRKLYKKDADEILLSYLNDEGSYLNNKKINITKGSALELAGLIALSIERYINIPMKELNSALLIEKLRFVTQRWKKGLGNYVKMPTNRVVNVEVMKKYVFGQSPSRIRRNLAFPYSNILNHCIYNLSVEFPATRSSISFVELLKEKDPWFNNAERASTVIFTLQKNIINDPVEHLPKKPMTEDQQKKALEIIVPVLKTVFKERVKENNNRELIQQNRYVHIQQMENGSESLIFHNHNINGFSQVTERRINDFSESHFFHELEKWINDPKAN